MMLKNLTIIDNMAELKLAGQKMMKSEKMKYPSEPILIVDIEGNGRHPPELVEISIQRFEPNSIKEPENYSWLIKPTNPIAWQVTKIHGIKNSDVVNKPSWDDIKEDVTSMLEKSWFVAHHAKVDYDVLKRLIPEWEPIGIIDTLRLAKKILPDATSYSLENLIKFTKILQPCSKAFHRASFDVQATSELFKYLIIKSEYSQWDDICNISQVTPPSKNADTSPIQGELW